MSWQQHSKAAARGSSAVQQAAADASQQHSQSAASGSTRGMVLGQLLVVAAQLGGL